jgi:hypothetical protein
LQVRAMKRVLQAVKVLVSTKGNTGKALRQSVTESVFTVNNLHDTLQYCEMLAGERRPWSLPKCR